MSEEKVKLAIEMAYLVLAADGHISDREGYALGESASIIRHVFHNRKAHELWSNGKPIPKKILESHLSLRTILFEDLHGHVVDAKNQINIFSKIKEWQDFLLERTPLIKETIDRKIILYFVHKIARTVGFITTKREYFLDLLNEIWNMPAASTELSRWYENLIHPFEVGDFDFSTDDKGIVARRNILIAFERSKAEAIKNATGEPFEAIERLIKVCDGEIRSILVGLIEDDNDVSEFLIPLLEYFEHCEPQEQVTEIIEAFDSGREEEILDVILRGDFDWFEKRLNLTPLQAVAKTNNTSAIRILINNGAPLGSNNYGLDALKTAIYNNLTNVATELINNGVQVNGQVASDIRERGAEFLSPLHCAVEMGNLAMVELLLAKGASIDAADSVGYTPLMVAILERENTVARKLLTAGASFAELADPKFIGEAAQNSALHCAVYVDNRDMVEALLDLGADPNLQNYDGEFPVWTAAKNGYDSVLEILLDNGANPEFGFGSNALTTSTESENIVYKTITPLAGSVVVQSLEAVRLLLGAGADPNAIMNSETMPINSLSIALASPNVEIIRLLIDHGADVNAVDGTKSAPIHHAMDFVAINPDLEDFEFLELLIEAGCDVNYKDEDGLSAVSRLMIKSAEAGFELNATVLSMLVAAGADLAFKIDPEKHKDAMAFLVKIGMIET
jgi:ankyrin repeat protein